MTELGGYVRHRDRMVQESVYQDLKDTLIACRWMAGTTSQPVLDPYGTPGTFAQVTTNADQVLPLTQGHPINLIDFFPKAELETFRTEINTFALDNGTADDMIPMEMGSNATEQQYTFTMAFWASSDAVALAVMNDLRDRYMGRLVRNETVALWDYNSGAPDPVVRMDIDSFRYNQNVDAVAPGEVHLFFAQLVLTDYVDAANS